MFNYATLKNIDDYFFPKLKRASENVFFYRMIGYSQESLDFLSRYYFETKKSGIYIKNTIPNPSDSEVQFFYKTIGNEFEFSIEFIEKGFKKWIPGLNVIQQKLLSEAIYFQLKEMEKKNNSINILKNTYIKFMCWLKYNFERLLYKLGEVEIPKVLYEGDIGKYELYMLKVLGYAGCDTLLVNFYSDEQYKKIDNNSEYSKPIYYAKKEMPSMHFTKIDWEKNNKLDKSWSQIQESQNIVKTNKWMTDDFFIESLKVNSDRGSNENEIYNMFVEYIGIDEQDEYENRLFNWKLSLDKKEKTHLIIEGNMENPNINEVNSINKVTYQTSKELILNLSENINISSDKLLNLLTKKAFIEVMNLEDTTNLAKINNRGICLLCWIKRYQEVLFSNYNSNNIPIFIHYGVCNRNEITFLKMLSKMPVDIVIIYPNLNSNNPIEISDTYKKVLENSMDIKEFPSKEKKMKASTVAYKAERELDTLLYNDTGLFRNRQFIKSCPVTLKTTYEEIDILWNEEAKYRPSFKVLEESVVVPTVFAKILGVKNGNIQSYWEEIKKKITDDTILIEEIPYLKSTDVNPVKAYVGYFCKNEKLQVKDIKSHKSYQYEYLSESVQDYVLDKIQDLIDINIIKSDKKGLEYTILSTLLNLDKTTIRLIQKFDFTKTIPKLIIINTKESMCSLEDCIYIAFLSLIGFDIVIFEPTGYHTVGKYLKQGSSEEHQIGEYMFDIKIPNLKMNKQGKGILNKLLGRGRN